MAFFDGAAKAPKPRSTHMTFRLEGQLYGIPLDMVSHVIALENMLPLKASDPAVAGEIALDDGAIVVLDMGVRLAGKPIKDTSGKCVVIVKRSRARSGCLFDAAQGLAFIPEDEICRGGYHPPAQTGPLSDDALGEIETCALLAQSVEGVTSIPDEKISPVEDASTSGETLGFPLYKVESQTILLPERAMFFPI